MTDKLTEWTTIKPTEPGFYFATDGSPVVELWAINMDGDIIETFVTWQTAWAGKEPYFVPNMFPQPEPKYWCKIPLPNKPKEIIA